MNHRDHWEHSEKVRVLTAQQNGLNFPALVGYCAFWGLCMFVFLVAGLQLLLKTSGAPSCPVCKGLMLRQEACEQPTPLYCSSPSQQPPSSLRTPDQHAHLPPYESVGYNQACRPAELTAPPTCRVPSQL